MKKVASILLCVALLLTVVLSACSANNADKNSQTDAADKDKGVELNLDPKAMEKTLETTFKQLFTVPHPACAEFVKDDLPTMGLETMPPENIQDTIKDGMLDKVLAEMAKDKKNVISDSIMEAAWDHSLYELSSICVGNNAKAKISNIKITPSEEHDTVLNFTATIAYTKDGETNDIELTGTSSFDANGKMMAINYNEDTIKEIINALK